MTYDLDDCAAFWHECHARGVTPSCRDMAAYVGSHSPTTGRNILKRLVEHGMIPGRRTR